MTPEASPVRRREKKARHPDQTFVVRLVQPPNPPYEAWAVILGDAVHNLRSSLEYMAWELAGADPTDTETMFPIFDTEAGWNARASRRMKRLAPDVRALIQSMQPYYVGQPSGVSTMRTSTSC